MSFSVRMVDAEHRPDLYAEIEYDEELVAEVFVEGGQMRVAIVGLDGTSLWVASLDDLQAALSQAREELAKFGLLE